MMIDSPLTELPPPPWRVELYHSIRATSPAAKPTKTTPSRNMVAPIRAMSPGSDA